MMYNYAKEKIVEKMVKRKFKKRSHAAY